MSASPAASPSAMPSQSFRPVSGLASGFPRICAFPCDCTVALYRSLTRLPLRGQRRHCSAKSAPASRFIPRVDTLGTPVACNGGESIRAGQPVSTHASFERVFVRIQHRDMCEARATRPACGAARRDRFGADDLVRYPQPPNSEVKVSGFLAYGNRETRKIIA